MGKEVVLGLLALDLLKDLALLCDHVIPVLGGILGVGDTDLIAVGVVDELGFACGGGEQ